MSTGSTVFGVTSDNTKLYFNVVSTSNNFASICLYTISTNSMTCAYLTNTEYTGGLISVGASDYIGVYKGRPPAPEIHFARMSIGSSNSVWAQKLSCTSCTLGHTSFELNSGSTQVHVMYPLNDGGSYPILMTLDASTGALVGSMYKSTTSCSDAINIFLKGTILYGAVECGSDVHLFSYDTVANTFGTSYKQNAGFTFNKYIGNSQTTS